MLGKGKLVGRKDYRRSGEGKGREKRGRRRGGIAPWGGCCGTDVWKPRDSVTKLWVVQCIKLCAVFSGPSSTKSVIVLCTVDGVMCLNVREKTAMTKRKELPSCWTFWHATVTLTRTQHSVRLCVHTNRNELLTCTSRVQIHLQGILSLPVTLYRRYLLNR